MLILLAAACLVWIGLLSLAFMYFTGAGVSAGWIFAGALFLAFAIWAVVMFREVRNAIWWPKAFGNDNCELHLGYEPMATRSRSKSADARTNSMSIARREMTLGHRNRTLPCKRTSRQPTRPGRHTTR